jgi:AcrR family transcriptional regulator
MATHPAAPRRDREREIVRATRALFDERGMQDAPVEEIARAVGIARGLIYRVFSSKEELYVLTVTDYLAELDGILVAARDDALDPCEQLERWSEAYVGFCLRYPAYLDCALSLMHRPAGELRDVLSESVWFRLGQGIAACLVHVTDILEAGNAPGPHRRVAQVLAQDAGLAEDVARPERRDDLAVVDDLGLALVDDRQVVRVVALANELGALLDAQLVRGLGDRADGLLVEALEQRELGQALLVHAPGP